MTAGNELEPTPARVDVKLGPRSYPILIGAGLLRSAGHYLSDVLPGARFAIVADLAVQSYAEELERVLFADRLLVGKSCLVPSGEASKSFSQLERICLDLLDLGLERSHAVIALGGGVVGDLAGFAAAIVKRGVRVVQMPTTLLAQVDSSVGGKTGINTSHGKNLIGAFHQPSLVIADLSTLETLPPREFRSGYAEIVKYGVLGDAAFFEWLQKNADQVFARQSDALTHAIKTSCQMKADIVAGDEFETGERAHLNLGHTFGHALEAWAGYSGKLLHGEAVAFGMVLAAEFSEHMGFCGPEVAHRLKAHLGRWGFVTDFGALQHETGELPSLAELISYMEQDKKVIGGRMRLILLRGIGEAFVAAEIPRDAISGFLGQRLSD